MGIFNKDNKTNNKNSKKVKLKSNSKHTSNHTSNLDDKKKASNKVSHSDSKASDINMKSNSDNSETIDTMVKNSKRRKVFLTIGTIAILLYLIYNLIVQQIKLNSYSKEQDNVKLQIEQQQEYKNKLTNTKSNMDSNEFIEDIARNKLDMYKPNEKVYYDQSK